MVGAFVGSGAVRLSPSGAVRAGNAVAGLARHRSIVRRRQASARSAIEATAAAATASDASSSPCSVELTSAAAEDSDAEPTSIVRLTCGQVPFMLNAAVHALLNMGLVVDGYLLREGEVHPLEIEISVARDGKSVPDSEVDAINAALSKAYTQQAALPIPQQTGTRTFVERSIAELKDLDTEQFADYETGAFVRVDNNALTTLSSVTYFSADKEGLSGEVLTTLSKFELDIKFASSIVSDFEGRYRTAVFHVTSLSGDKLDERTELDLSTSLFDLSKTT